MTLEPIAEGVLVHESECIQSRATVVLGPSGALVVDPGITRAELAGIAAALRGLRQPVVAAFATHPDWDHVLWHAELGEAPRFGTAACAAATAELLARPGWQEELAPWLPPEFIDDIPMELLGLITPVPDASTHVPWDSTAVRILEHRGHAAGHAALLVEERGVLVAGDMVSDILVPFLDLGASDPIGDYLAGLDVLEGVAAAVNAFVPGHGSVGDGAELRARIALDRAYVTALRDGEEPADPRIGSSAPLDWMVDVHRAQADALAGRPLVE
ncbi:MBL fold metallo-hydrolase [Agrococcus sp. TF02-05]|uniref:MBL fold metallo-hydrolase n=1 Tax=Agrococcus sp. TF02-05 TaxID=2815211 RepID=UPI001AA110FF|nr:MBL fold metallo-hydrolase [Agrococcus sp. TF02-05]MBO1771083.1 MBL fold metallo-hydrolase [Agrococcus sp. TF02-05]